MAILFKGGKAYRPSRGGRFNIGSAPRIGGKTIRYKPTIAKQADLPAGEGWTSWWGDITVSTRGSIEEQNLVSLHEYVHSFLSPKFSILRNYRAYRASYGNASLYRYIEEALAVTISQVGIKGWGNFFKGIKFPVQNGYMHLTIGGSLINSRFTGSGLLPEAAVLISQGIALGFNYHLYFELNSPPVFNVGAM